MQLEQKYIELIKQYLVEKISPYLIILYGSATSGNMLAGSDIDVAFLSDKKYSPYEIFMVSQELADKLGRDVDLVDLESASTVFQARVVTSGKTIYCGNEKKRMLFQMLTLKKYARLNEERRYILEKIEGRGLFYAQ